MNVSNEEIERILDEKYAAHLVLREKKDRLWDMVQAFIIANRVSHAAILRSVNSVKDNFPELVEGMADIVGYFTFPEDDTVTGK